MTEPHDGPHDGSRQDPPEVGSVGDEAAKLLGALSAWARDSGADLTDGLGAGLGQTLSGLAGHAAATVSELSAHLDTGAPECAYCPVCRTVHVLRTTSPEVKAHLASAASSLLQAVAGVLATLPPAGSAGAAGSDYERIDLDEDDELDGDEDDQ